MPGPLTGLRVLELAILAGVGGADLADLGADVIKVERKGHGDDTRAWGPPSSRPPPAQSRRRLFPFDQPRQALDRVDFESEEGQRIVRALASARMS